MRRSDPFPFELTVTVGGSSPSEIEKAAYPIAERFFGADAELHIVSAKVEPGSRDGQYVCTAVFRRVTT